MKARKTSQITPQLHRLEMRIYVSSFTEADTNSFQDSDFSTNEEAESTEKQVKLLEIDKNVGEHRISLSGFRNISSHTCQCR